jgi:hypothetical protein
MTDKLPEFENADKKGSSDPFSGNATTSWVDVPASPGNLIQEFTVINDSRNDLLEYLEISIDGGSTVLDKIYPSGHLSHLVKGDITEISLRGQSASVAYRVILNRELN